MDAETQPTSTARGAPPPGPSSLRSRWEAVYPSAQPGDDVLIAEWVAEHGSLWKRMRAHRPGIRALRAAMATLTLVTGLAMFQPAAASAAVNNPYTGPLPVIDGKLDQAYGPAFASITYTQTNASPSQVTGQIAVLETADAYYVAFQQGLNRKSNAYCSDTKASPGCYQKFNDLVGSDHISFTWPDAASRTGVTKTLQVGVDILTADKTGTALYGYRGEVKKPSTGNVGEGLALLGCANDAGVTGYSGEDYNWHHAGGVGYGAPATQAQALLNSPNFNGLENQFPDYVYPSTAEIRLDKTQCDLADNLNLAGTAQVLAHNSPGAPTSTNPAWFIQCDAANPTTGTLGVETFLKLNVIQVNPDGTRQVLAGKKVFPSLEPGSVGSITTPPGGGSATTDAAGQASIGITSSDTGTANLFAAVDMNLDNVYTPGVDPVTNPTCPLNFSGTPPDMRITKSANKTSVNAPGSITYTMTAHNAGGSPANNVVISDDLNDNLIITAASVSVNGGAAQNCTFTAGNVLTCNAGTLAPDDGAPGGPDTAVATVTVTAPPAACPSVRNQAHVQATNEQNGQITDTKANPNEDNWSLPVDVDVICGPSGIQIHVEKTNDANNDGTYHDAEVAPAEGATVKFRAVITNPSAVPVKITALTDLWQGQAAFHPTGCDNVINQILDPVGANGQPSLACDFTVSNYAPPAGAAAKVNTVRVDAVNPNDTTQTAFDEDKSSVTVNPVNPPVITVDLIKTNDANGDATFHKSEIAQTAGKDVPFHLEIRNTSSVDIKIDKLTDDAGPGTPQADVCSTGAGSLIGRTLQPYTQANNFPTLTCDFTLPGYAPPAGAAAKVNTAHVDVSNAADSTQKASDEDTSAVTVNPVNPPVISVNIDKTNDANGDGTYNDAEMAPTAGADVPFRAVIKNTSQVPVDIVSLTDAFPGSNGAHAIAACGNLIGQTLAPYNPNTDSPKLTCNWTETAYSWAANLGPKINTAQVVVGETGNTNNQASDQDTSSVTSPPAGITVSIVKTNDANGDGTYTDAEIAPTEGADVPFRAVITNTSAVAVQLLDLTDSFQSGNVIVTPDICPNLVTANTQLAPNGQPGDSVTCEWTEQNYSWAPNMGAKLNTAAVVVGEVGNLGNTATANDTSAVSTLPPQISVDLVKDNDADRDGTYHDAEIAPNQGADVPFRAVITNTSNVPVRIDQLTDLLPGQVNADNICAGLINTVLQPGDHATCTWTEPGYAGAPNTAAKVNTARVKVSQVNHPDRTATDQDDSSVTTKQPGNITVKVDKTNDANGDGTYTDAEQAATAGAAVTFKAVVTNTSNVAVRITTLTDEWPNKVPFGICTNLIGTVLDPGESVTCTFTQAGYAPAAGTSLTDTVTVTVVDVNNPGNTGTDDDTSTVTTPNPEIDLSVTKTDDVDPVTLGNGDVTYTIVGKNNGPITATGVTLSDSVPEGLIVKSVTMSLPSQCSAVDIPVMAGQPDPVGGGTFTCVLNDPLPVGGTVTMTIVVTPTRVGTFRDVVTIKGDQHETDLTNNQDDEDTTVIAPDLAINKDDGGATFTVGQTNGKYTLVVSNVGNASTFGPITVTDTLPAGLTYVSATGVNWNCTNAGAVITCNYSGGNLAPGESAPTITVTVSVDAAAVPQVVNPAHVTTPGDVNPANDNDQEPTPVALATVLGSEITKTPTTPATPTQVAGAVAYTGAGHVRELVELGLLLLLLGGALLLLGRSRVDEALVAPAAGSGRRAAPAASWFDRTPLGPAWDRMAGRGRWNRRDGGRGRTGPSGRR